MPLPFLTAKEDALQTMMSRIYDTLRDRGVPDVRLPEPKHLISHIMLWIDEEKMNAWIDGFAKLETINGAQPEKVVGTSSPANEAITQTGQAVIDVVGAAKIRAGNILGAVKQTILGQKS
jgi:hypothetical protein